MELEVYNEYAIVQHYSDLTDYISENIYMLDKDEQSEIITENWGLVAVGALLLGGLIWLIIHLVTNAKKNKAKEVKLNKDAENAEKIKDAAEKAIEQSGASKEDIGDITNLIKCCMICPDIVEGRISAKAKTDSPESAIRGSAILWKYEYIHIIKAGPYSNQLNDLRNKKNALTKAKEEYINTGYGLIKKWAEEISISDFEKEITDEINKNRPESGDGPDIKIYIDQKLREIAHRIFNENNSYKDDLEKSRTLTNDQANKKAIGHHNNGTITSTQDLIKKDPIVQKYFQNVNPSSAPSPRGFIKTKDKLSDSEQAFFKLLKEINTSDDILNSFPKVNNDKIKEDDKIDHFIDLIINATDSNTIQDTLSTYGSLMLDLIDKMDTIKKTSNNDDLTNENIIAITNVYLNALLESVISWYGTNPYIINTMSIWTGSKVDLSTASSTTPRSVKEKMEKKFKEWEKETPEGYKKALNKSIDSLMQETLFIQSIYNTMDDWIKMIAKDYILILISARVFTDSNIKRASTDPNDIKNITTNKKLKVDTAADVLKTDVKTRLANKKQIIT